MMPNCPQGRPFSGDCPARCGCGRKAKYLVYAHEEPHCEVCLLDAADTAKPILVRGIG